MALLLEDEAKHLTSVGNRFRVRHHESDKTELDERDVDYLFHRCFAFLGRLLGFTPSSN
jgi:hypothetical protein